MLGSVALVLFVGCATRHSPEPQDALRVAAERTGWAREDGLSAEGARSTWCWVPDSVTGCIAPRFAPGQAWRVLEPGRWEAAEVPRDGWGGRLEVAEDAWSLELVRHANGTETDRMALGRDLLLTVEIDDVRADGGDFTGFVAEQTIGDAVCSRLATIYGAAISELRAGRIHRCHYGRYTGDASIACIPTPLPASEAEAWIHDLGREEARHCAQVRTDAKALAALVRTLWPIGR